MSDYYNIEDDIDGGYFSELRGTPSFDKKLNGRSNGYLYLGDAVSISLLFTTRNAIIVGNNVSHDA